MKQLIKYYNEGQSKYKPTKFMEINGEMYIDIKHGGSYIGFYEFLFNPKYGVMKVFLLQNMETVLCYRDFGDHKYGLEAREIKEIINYLNKTIGAE